MTRDFYKQRLPGTLKAAQAALVHACGGPGLARTRVGKSVLHAATDSSETNRNRHLAADVILDLERQAREPIVSRFLLLSQGWLAVPLRAGAEPYPLALARITSETGELLSAGGAAIRDGKVTVNEARLLKREAMDVAVALSALIADCDAVLARDGDT